MKCPYCSAAFEAGAGLLFECPKCRGVFDAVSAGRGGETRAADPTLAPARRRGRECPFCGSDDYAVQKSAVHPVGWVFMALWLTISIVTGVLFCLPFFGVPLAFLGLAIRTHYAACSSCGARLEGF